MTVPSAWLTGRAWAPLNEALAESLRSAGTTAEDAVAAAAAAATGRRFGPEEVRLSVADAALAGDARGSLWALAGDGAPRSSAEARTSVAHGLRGPLREGIVAHLVGALRPRLNEGARANEPDPWRGVTTVLGRCAEAAGMREGTAVALLAALARRSDAAPPTATADAAVACDATERGRRDVAFNGLVTAALRRAEPPPGVSPVRLGRRRAV